MTAALIPAHPPEVLTSRRMDVSGEHEVEACSLTAKADSRSSAQHKVALDSLRSQADKIRYACEQIPRPTTAAVRDWLATYMVRPDRSHLSSVVSAWRKQNGVGSTGELVKLTPELIAELDSIATAPRKTPDVVKPREEAPGKPQKRFSTWVFLLGALVGLVVSVDTSWRFFPRFHD